MFTRSKSSDNDQPRTWYGSSSFTETLPRYEPADKLPTYEDSQRNAGETARSRPATTPPRTPKQKRKLDKCSCICALIWCFLLAIVIGGFLKMRPYERTKESSTHDHDIYDDDDSDGWLSTSSFQQSHIPFPDISFPDVDGMLEGSQDIVARDIGCEQVTHDANCDVPAVQIPSAVAEEDAGTPTPRVETVAERDDAIITCRETPHGVECDPSSFGPDLPPTKWPKVSNTSKIPENDEGNPIDWIGPHIGDINRSPILREPSDPHVSPGDFPAVYTAHEATQDIPPHKYRECLEDPEARCEGVPTSRSA